MALLLPLVSLLLAAVISVVCLPAALHLLAGLVGHRLRRASRTRRELLLDRVATETRSLGAAPLMKTREDDDWEKVGAPPSGSTGNGAAADADWNGIVGFFHPFW
jgi:alpha-1,2-mannosyltransferase